jgi:hypothetical protein
LHFHAKKLRIEWFGKTTRKGGDDGESYTMRKRDQASSAAVPEGYTTSGAEFLMSEEVAQWLRVSQATLCRWRQSGCGPRVTWMSRSCPRYRRSDVESWLEKVSA